MKHPEFGDLKYSEVYFKLEEPILFTCYFSNTPDKYVGIMVEDFEMDDIRIKSWYFAGVLQNEISMLERVPGKLKELFEQRPVWWCNDNNGKIVWKKQPRVFSAYSFCETATLS